MKLLKVAKVLEQVTYHQDGFLVKKETGERASRLWKNEKYYKLSCGKNTKVFEHRAIWFLIKGSWPKVIDHINGNRLDNRIENLRECTAKENSRNRHACNARKHALPRNVYRQAEGRYKVLIQVEGKMKHIGSFTSVEDAANVAHQARERYYGTFSGS